MRENHLRPSEFMIISLYQGELKGAKLIISQSNRIIRTYVKANRIEWNQIKLGEIKRS
jgi:hypothetical protein